MTQQYKHNTPIEVKIEIVINALMQIRLLMLQFGIVEWGGCGDCGSPWVNYKKESNLSVDNVNIYAEPQDQDGYKYVLKFNVTRCDTAFVAEDGTYTMKVT